MAWVDLDSRKVERLLDTGALPLAKSPVFAQQPAATLRPLDITQPQGPSFRFDGHLVEWDNWRFRYSFDPREGLVLYSVGYAEQGKVRPILYRASLAEMVVPYGDPSPAWSFRNAFDISEYAFTARSMFPRTLGADVPVNAAFLDATFADEEGKAYTTQRAAALYERDGGVLWRYADLNAGQPCGPPRARPRPLFVSIRAAVRIRLQLDFPPGRKAGDVCRSYRHHDHQGS